jgi:stalled ribosome rescue protein Dom34
MGRVPAIVSERSTYGMRIATDPCMSTYHAAVWIDHNEARIFHVTESTFDESVIQSPKAHTQLHRRLGSDDGHRAPEDQHYYHEVAQALANADDVLILGPATAKLELIKHAHRRDPKLEAKIIGVETVDHPTDGQIVAYVRSYFKQADLIRGA